MKMIITIIHDEDSHRLLHRLNSEGVMATKLASTGGLLKTGNTTFFIGIEEEKVDFVIGLIKEECQTTKQMSLINPPISNMPEGFMSYPVEVTVGGATIFVIDVDQYLKI
ncbi:cyclic-di-AMP receptor [Anaerotalea alkaliphila]|uniref:Transcriptional regulator n=1 Tax=Anaerotalea alkaliphila TaxID=2662126 RepID=A0A7X5HW44_9FIRM|nr:cyclic-di-AMP receptor [Anaerotalea alkaliphila]NDL67734.1 hypothetical protein [Anaerotalea alkaliphila]